MAVTLKQIAQHSGLAVVTVSQILNNKGDLYRPATRDRVLRAAEELGYRPHSSARSMRTGRFDCIGLALSTHSSYSTLPRYTLDGINRGLASHQYHLTVATLSDETLTDDTYVPKMLSQWMVDGLLLNYSLAIPARLQHLVSEHQLPTIWMNSQHAADCIFPDDQAAARQATERLLALGHTRIAYGGYRFAPEQPLHYSVSARADGYAEALEKAGRVPRRFEVDPVFREQHALVRSLLSGADRPTAIVTYWPSVANVVLCEALSLELRVPEDLTIVTFSDVWLKEQGLPISTWLIPSLSLGEQAIEMLLLKIADPSCRQPPRPLAFLEDTEFLAAPPH